MSESNNVPKSNSSAKRTFAGLLIFGIICVAVTYACIYMTLKTRKQVRENLANENTSAEEIIDTKDEKNTKNKTLKLTDKATLNGITINSEKEHYGDVVDYYEYNDTYTYKMDIDYLQISGLKDRNVQARINQEIKDKVDELKEKYMSELDNQDVDRIAITATSWSNFSDVISIRLDEYIHYDYNDEDYENDTYDAKYYGLNFSLVDGERLSFRDLFWDDSPIKTIVSKSAYTSLAWAFAYEEEGKNWENGGWDWNMDHIDYSVIESRVFKFMQKFNQNQDVEFYFTTSNIEIPYDKYDNISIEMADFYKYIAIYTKYKSSKNLYEDNSKQKEFYVFASYVPSVDESYSTESGYRANNVYYKIDCYDDLSEFSEEGEKSHQEGYRSIIKQINEYAKTFKNDSEHGYVIVGYYNASDVSEYNETAGYNFELEVARCSREYFDKKLEEALAAEQRHVKADIVPTNFVYIDEENFEFYEAYHAWMDDYQSDSPEINIYTKEDRERDMAEWENYNENEDETDSKALEDENFSEETSEN